MIRLSGYRHDCPHGIFFRRITWKKEAVTLANKIAAVRKACGWSQASLAAAIGTTPSQLLRWEKGQRDPQGSVLVKIADTLGVSIDSLLGREPAAPAEEPGEGELGFIYRSLPEDGREALLAIARTLKNHVM